MRISEQVKKIIDALVERYEPDELVISFGPAHIVFDDYNVDDSALTLCMDRIVDSLCDLSQIKLDLPAFEVFYKNYPHQYAERFVVHTLLETFHTLKTIMDIPEEDRYGEEETDSEE